MPKSKGKKSTKSTVQQPWDPTKKELWHLELENIPVSDDKWTCSVVAAVEAQAQTGTYITMFNEAAVSRLRSQIRTITMSEVVKLLKPYASKKGKKGKTPKSRKTPKSSGRGKDNKTAGLLAPPAPKYESMLQLAGRFAQFSEGEVKLPPDLMAGVVKYLILKMKGEDCFQRQMDYAKAKKKKETELKKIFIENHKPPPPPSEGTPSPKKSARSEEKEKKGKKKEKGNKGKKKKGNVLGITTPIYDAPYGGPDMYILLSGFYNPLYFPEMQKINIPFLAIFRVETIMPIDGSESRPTTATTEKSSKSAKSKKSKKGGGKKEALVNRFWKTLDIEAGTYKTSSVFSDIAMVKYIPPVLETQTKTEVYQALYENISQMQYNIQAINRQNKNFISQNLIQFVDDSYGALKIKKCEVYTKLMDAIPMANSEIEFLIVHCMIEQVIAGVPPCGEIVMEDFICKEVPVTPTDVPYNTPEMTLSLTKSKSVMSIDEKGDHEQPVKELKWKNPITISYGDYISLITIHIDKDILNPKSIIRRFLMHSAAPSLYRNLRALAPAEKAYYEHHFYRLWKFSRDTKELFKLKVNICLAFRMLALSTMMRTNLEVDEILGECLEEAYIPENVEVSTKPLTTLDLLPLAPKFFNVMFREMKAVYNYPITEPIYVEETEEQIHEITMVERPKIDYTSIEAYEFKPSPSEAILNHDLTQLRTMLECPEVLTLTEPTFLGDPDNHESRYSNYSVYEKLEPQEIVQILKTSLDYYNEAMYEYYQPTDSIIILFHNHLDHLGLDSETYNAYLPTPVLLRDFTTFLYKDCLNWLKKEEKKHFRFLELCKIEDEVRNKEKEIAYLDQITEEFNAMNETQQKEFLGITPPPEKKTGKKKAEKPKKTGRSKTPKTAKEEIVITVGDIEELPNKKEYVVPEKKTFVTQGISHIREQIDVTTHQFFSKDGTKVKLDITSWLFSKKNLMSLEIRKYKTSLFVHQWLEEEIFRNVHVHTGSGVLFAFSEKEPEPKPVVEEVKPGTAKSGKKGKKEKKPKKPKTPKSSKSSRTETASTTKTIEIPDAPFIYSMRASWPSGLVIETKPGKLSTDLYIKQRYVSNTGPGVEEEKEVGRCFLRNGHLLIEKTSGNIDILGVEGSKIGCYEFYKPPPPPPPEPPPPSPKKEKKGKKEKGKKEKKEKGSKGSKNEKGGEKDKKDKGAKKGKVKSADAEARPINIPPPAVPPLEPKPPLIEIYDYDILTPQGEFWAKPSREKCPNEKRLIETMTVLTAENILTGESFWKRADGTFATLWGDGSLVVTYADGTKITSTPQFDDEDVVLDWSDEEKKFYLKLEAEMRPDLLSAERVSILSSGSSPKNRHRSSVTFSERNREKSNSSRSTRGSPPGWFDPNNLDCFRVEKFVCVKCSVMYEHPKYASVHFPVSGCITITMPNKVDVDIFENGLYRVTLEENVELDVKENSIEFTSKCPECKAPSISTLNFTYDREDVNPVFCTTNDLFGKVFTILKNGEISLTYDTISTPHVVEVEQEMSMSTIETQLSLSEPKQCYHNISNGWPNERCFILNRDLTGYEIVSNEVLERYVSKQPREGSANINIESDDQSERCHTFFTPVYRDSVEEWTMDYIVNDGIPRSIVRKDLRPLKEHKERFRLPFPQKCLRTIKSTSRSELSSRFQSVMCPKALVMRTFNTFQPSIEDMIRDVKETVSKYHEDAERIIKTYEEHTVPDERAQEEKFVEMKLKRIALTVNQSLTFHPNLGMQIPSCEKEVHQITHKLQQNETIKNESAVIDDIKINLHMDQFILPKCDEIITPLAHSARDDTLKELGPESI